MKSKKSLTASDLSRYFRDGKAKVDEDAKSRISEITKGTFRSRFSRTKDAGEPSAEKETSPKVERPDKADDLTAENEEIIQEITYESEKSDDEEENNEALKTIEKPTHSNLATLEAKPVVQKEGSDDAATVATTAVDALSVAPTEQLAAEYKKLMDQYDQEIHTRKMLEEEIEKLKEATQ